MNDLKRSALLGFFALDFIEFMERKGHKIEFDGWGDPTLTIDGEVFFFHEFQREVELMLDKRKEGTFKR